MKKLPQIFAAALLGFLALSTATAQAQTSKPLPPWISKKIPAPAPTPQPTPQPTTQPSQTLPPSATVPGDARPDQVYRAPNTGNPEYTGGRYRKGHPHGMPPGQAKKRGYAANPSNGGLPPGQAKKAYRGHAPVPGTVYVKDEKHEGKGKSKGGKWMNKR